MAEDFVSSGAPADSPSSSQGVDPSTTAPGTLPGGSTPSQSVPYDRFQEVIQARNTYRDRAQQIEARLTQLQEQSEREKRQFAAAMGLAPSDPNQENLAQVRQAILQVMPELEPLLSLSTRKGDLEALLEQAPQLAASVEYQYDQLADQTLGRLYQQAREAYGGDLTPFQRQMLHRAFVSFVESQPAQQERYVKGDPALVGDFWTAFRGGMLDPIRRSATVASAARIGRTATLPQSGPSTGPLGTTPPAPATEDELHERAWNRLQAALSR